MTVEQALRAQLLSIPALTAIVGQRIYLDEPEPGIASPFVVVGTVSESEPVCQDGPSGFATTSLEVIAICKQNDKVKARSQARSIGRLLRKQFNGFAGQLGGGEGLDVETITSSDGSVEAIDSQQADARFYFSCRTQLDIIITED